MTDIYEILLIVNIASLTAVIIHNLISSRKSEPKAEVKILRKRNKPREMSEEEKRDAEILDEISKYNGMEVRK